MQKENVISFNVQEGYLRRIQFHLDNMSETEKKIADYILTNSDSIDWSLSISDLADKSNVSVSTVVRFCRTLGFKGFSDFKFYVQRGSQDSITELGQIEQFDSAEVIKQKVSLMVKNAIDDTVLMMDNDHLERAIEALSHADTILICGEGPAFGTAQGAAASFINMGKHAVTYNDPLTSLRALSFMKKNDVVIGINRRGQMRSVIDSFIRAQELGITTIAITEKLHSKLTEHSDIVLCTSVVEQKSGASLQATVLCQHLTLQMLQIGVIVRNQDHYSKMIEDMYCVMKCRQYPSSAPRTAKKKNKKTEE